MLAADAPHAPEHALEVELPFLQALLPRFTAVPLLVGDAHPKEVAAVLDRLWGGPETIVVVSSDLSHFHDYEAARRRDAETAAAIEGALSVRGTRAATSRLSACSPKPPAVVSQVSSLPCVTQAIHPDGVIGWWATELGFSWMAALVAGLIKHPAM